MTHGSGSLKASEIQPARGWRYVPGLDGMRALAVGGVLLFHGGVGWFKGGLLGVDIFFVLSGFLITSLLVSEFRATGTISFRSFYARRARRLLPALLLTILGVSAFALVLVPASGWATIRGDALATLGYVANWRYVLTDQNYFVQTGPPSPLLHTWSLAVEEQFYLVWPAVTLFVLRRWRTRGLTIVAPTLALASGLWCLLLLHGGASPSRLYYGTDVRVQEVMVGATLAALWRGTPGEPLGQAARRWWKRVLPATGLLGLAVLVWCLHTVDGQARFLYEGGFLLVSLSTVAVLASIVAVPGSPTDRLFSLRPLRYVGRISYGIYLYHWPLFLVLDESRTHLSGGWLLGLRLLTTLAVAAASYHFVEAPLRGVRPVVTWRRMVMVPGAVALVVVALLLSTLPPPGTTSGALSTAPASATPIAPSETQPVRGLILGDSVMVELSFGLTYQSERWGVQLVDKATLNCDLFSGTQIMQGGSPRPQPEGCPDWRSTWASEVAQVNPDVVLIGVGRWELADRFYEGRWRSPEDPVMRREMERLLEEAVAVVTSHGAHVVFSTVLYADPDVVGENGLPDPMNDPRRVNAYNGIVRQVAAHDPRTVSVLDLNKLLCPQGHFTLMLDGIEVRDPDGIHPSPAGGAYIRPVALPLLQRSGLPHLEARLDAPRAPSVSSITR